MFFGRVDLQLGNRHRIYARANYATYDGLNGTSSSQTQSTSHNGIEGLTSSSYVASWNALFGSSVINDLNLQYARNDVPRRDKGLGLPEIRVGGTPKMPAATLGEVDLLPSEATDHRISIGDTATFLAGAHMIKIGGDQRHRHGRDLQARLARHLYLRFEGGLSQRQVGAIHRVPRTERKHGRPGRNLRRGPEGGPLASPRTSGS